MANYDSSETSALLPKNDNPSYSTTTTAVTNDIGNLVSKPLADEEYQTGEVNRDSQFQGLPEVKKKLKYILPAVAIGVWECVGYGDLAKMCFKIFLSAADQTIIVSSYGKIGSDLNALNKTSWISTG